VFERFTEDARQVVVLAQEEARTLKHNYIGTEHILLGLLREERGVAARVLGSLDITVERVRAQIVRIVGAGEEVTSGQIPFTPRAKKVLELALREALTLGHNYVASEHILLGLVRENEGVAARVLLDFDADSERIRNEVIRTLRRGPRIAAAAHRGPNPLRLPLDWERAGILWRPDRVVRGAVREFERVASLVLEREFGVRISRVAPRPYPPATRPMPRTRVDPGAGSVPAPHHVVLSQATPGLGWAQASVLWRPEGLELRVPLRMDYGAMSVFANDEVWQMPALAPLRREIWKGWLALASPTLLDDVGPDELRGMLDVAAARALETSDAERERVPNFLRRLHDRNSAGAAPNQ
jgi:hypothetical protein